MVARFARLRLSLLGSAFRGSAAHTARIVALGILACAVAVAPAVLPGLVGGDAAERAAIDVVVCTTVLAAALIVPLFANSGHLEPRQFSFVPVAPRAIAGALLLTTPLTWTGGLFLVWLGALVALRPEWHAVPWAAAIGVVLAAAIAILAVRLSSGLAKLLLAPRHAGVLRALGGVLVVAALPVLVLAAASLLSQPSDALAAETAQVLGWTPLGAPIAAIELAAAGQPGAALARFAVSAALALALGLAWVPLVSRSLEQVDRPIDPSIARLGLGWFERFSARPASVVAARSLTYWARDPRYRIALAAIPVAPALMLFAFWVAGADQHWLPLLPLPVILLLLGWSLHNDIALDSTAIWIHVASGLRGRDDRAGRLAPALVLGVPLALVGSSVTVILLADWRALPAVLGMNLAILLTAVGVSSVFSALLPYPATRPGDSPFAQPAGAASGSGLAQTLSMGLTLLLAVPPVWLAVAAMMELEIVHTLIALVAGVGYGLVMLVLGVRLGGRIFDRTGPEIVALTQVFD